MKLYFEKIDKNAFDNNVHTVVKKFSLEWREIYIKCNQTQPALNIDLFFILLQH